ncbi:hypothetical protein SDC9_169112 [bioreactor metagenome]|uniref:MurNAc-LAA domain-containing protein n=1 Tax=bioreactor metagenome TaxID=1076179 RepID=A0A645G704_9ZZZZ
MIDKRKILCILGVVIILFSLFSVKKVQDEAVDSAAKASVNNYPLIIIDAGHGGLDGGAVAADGTVEKTINLDIAMKLNEVFSLFGFNTLMTRTSDDSIHSPEASSIRQKKVSDIHNRFKIIDEHPDAVFISIHQNKFEQSQYYGTQVFYSPNNIKSNVMAECIQESVKTLLQNENQRKCKKSGTEIYLLYHSEIPSVMVECGFVSNVNELKKLKNTEYQKQMAVSIFCGSLNYFSSDHQDEF